MTILVFSNEITPDDQFCSECLAEGVLNTTNEKTCIKHGPRINVSGRVILGFKKHEEIYPARKAES